MNALLVRRFAVACSALATSVAPSAVAAHALTAPPSSHAERPVALGIVAGRVTEAETGAAIAGAAVTIIGTTLGAVTGEDGRFVIARVAGGTQRVRVTVLGREPETKEVTVQDDGK